MHAPTPCSSASWTLAWSTWTHPGTTPCRYCTSFCIGNNRYVPELIRLSRDVNTPDTSALRLTPLRTAVTSGSDLAVGALLARGADPSKPVSKDKTLLDVALHMKEFRREKNLSGEVDRIITMLETGRAWPQVACSA